MNLMVPVLRGMLALLGLGLLASCNVTKYLEPDQELIVGQRIDLKRERQIENRSDLTYELGTLAKQQPNGNFLFLFPREWFFLANSQSGDTGSFGRFLRNTIGQPPAIYSDSLSRRSVSSMEDYLRYMGYFNAGAYHEADRATRQKVNLIYHVRPGQRYFIDSVSYRGPTPTIDSLLQVAKEESLLVPGGPLDLNRFDQEKNRLSNFLRNQGYAFFSPTYFDQLEVDTTRRPGYADIFLSVLPPRSEGAYRQYRVGDVTVITDYNPTVNDAFNAYKQDTVIDGIRLLSPSRDFRLRPGLLRDKIALRPGALHRRTDYEKTNLDLSGLGIYRFVRINQQLDSTREGVLNYLIQLSPSKKMSLGVDLDLNYTNRQTNVQVADLIGLSVSPNFQNKNLFGGAELLTTSLRAGVEVNPGRGPFFNTVDLGAEVSLNVPRFRDFGFYRFANRVGLLSDDFYAGLQDRANTLYSIGYEYLLIRNFYAYTIASTRVGYNFKKSPTTSYRINHFEVDILNPTTEPEFEAILATNQRLRRSFGDQYFVSLLFRNLEFTRTGRPDAHGRSVTLNGQLEVAGAELFAANRLANALGTDNREWTPGGDAVFAKYGLALAEVRANKQFTPSRALAGRFLFAIGRPFGGVDDVPYVKQFFSGGANSMRAWQPRGLGPGGYVDPTSLEPDNNLRLYQTGDLRLEFNLEYRFDLAGQGLFKGALFTDIGNIWTIERDEQRLGSQFSLREQRISFGEGRFEFVNQPFYRQLAVNAGAGLRFDLSYFIFRLDVAVPVRYNYPQDGNGIPFDRSLLPRVDSREFSERFYWHDFDRYDFGDLTFQLGLGYPF